MLQGLVSKAKNYLNRYASKIVGNELSFQVYYWGIQPVHLDNAVHKHHFYEVCYVLEGQGSYMDGDTEYPLEKGTLFLSRPEVWHQIRSRSGLFLLFVAFRVTEERTTAGAATAGEPTGYDALRHTRNFIMQAGEDSPSALIWRGLFALVTQSALPPAEMVESLSYALLRSFQLTFVDNPNPASAVAAPRSSSTLLYQAKLFVRDNLVRSPSLKDVAEYLHISERHLSRLFSQELGLTFTSYIRKEKVRHATLLLQGTSLPIKRIAQESGFGNLHYFSQVFAEETGTPPGRYRRMTTSLPDEAERQA